MPDDEKYWLADPYADDEEDRPEDALAGLGISDPGLLEAALREIAHRTFVPHEGGQVDVMQSDARFRVLAAGRRWGKTKLAAHEVIEAAQKPNQVVWWVANTYRNVARGYKEVVRQLPPSMLAKAAPSYTSNTLYLQLANGSVIEFYSGGSPDALAGEGVDFMVVDEGALIPDQVWNQMLRATLMDKGGRAIIISTPRGHNWFWKLYNMGLNQSLGEYAAWHFPQTSNPYVPLSETEAVKAELPEMIFRQEIMAEFLAAGASIFGTGLDKEGAVLSMLADPRGHLFMGIDLAKKDDFTVISACNEDRLPVYREKFNDISWPAQRTRIHEAVDFLRGQPGVRSVTALMDTTGLGDVVYDDLTDEGLDIIPIKFTNEWKDMAVRLLAADLEQSKAHILDEQLPEFSSYAMTMTPAGRYKYEAATGHDDEVSAKLLEHWGVVHEGPIGIINVDAAPVKSGIDVRNMPPQADLTELVPDSPMDIMRRASAWSAVEE